MKYCYLLITLMSFSSAFFRGILSGLNHVFYAVFHRNSQLFLSALPLKTFLHNANMRLFKDYWCLQQLLLTRQLPCSGRQCLKLVGAHTAISSLAVTMNYLVQGEGAAVGGGALHTPSTYRANSKGRGMFWVIFSQRPWEEEERRR